MDFKRFARGIDTKLVAVLIGLVIVTTVCLLAVERQRQNGVLVRTLGATTAQVQRLNTQIDEQAAAASAERDQLRRQNRATRTELRAVLAYLKAHGITVPVEVTSSGGGVTRGKGRPAHAPKPTPRPPSTSPTPGTPGPTGAPTPTGSPGVTDLICGLLPPSLCPF